MSGKLFRVPRGHLSPTRTGSLTDRLVNDTTKLQQALQFSCAISIQKRPTRQLSAASIWWMLCPQACCGRCGQTHWEAAKESLITPRDAASMHVYLRVWNHLRPTGIRSILIVFLGRSVAGGLKEQLMWSARAGPGRHSVFSQSAKRHFICPVSTNLIRWVIALPPCLATVSDI